ncbi:MAG: 2Fe-2S iron-sulfur cluster binding domain-containing protein [bacterium]|nr:2Fe-2S iron-sulfur cluster binding domain-containing protein [bacterium]
MIALTLTVTVLAGIAAGLAALLVLAERYISNYGECTIDINNGSRIIVAQGGKSLLSTLVEQKLFIPSACGGRGTCGYCKVTITEGGGPVLPTEEPFLTKEERAAGIRLSCQCKLRNSLKITIPEELLNVREFTCIVEHIKPLTHDIREFRFKLVNPPEISYIPGQYVQLLTPRYPKSDEEVYRAYSISSDPRDRSVVELVIRLVPGGICTTYCFEYLKPGDTVRFNGPYGEFRLSNTTAPIIMIAGGSGMAPIKCLLHHMQNEGITRETHYFFGANYVHELFYLDLLRHFEQTLPNFKFTPVVAKPETEWPGETGWVTQAVDRICGDLSQHEAYLCGSPGMIDSAINVLTAHHMPPHHIFYDKFA